MEDAAGVAEDDGVFANGIVVGGVFCGLGDIEVDGGGFFLSSDLTDIAGTSGFVSSLSFFFNIGSSSGGIGVFNYGGNDATCQY